MQITVKYIGILAIVLSFTGFGFLKARQKNDTAAWLKGVITALNKADNMLRTGGYGREKIFEAAFYGVPGFYYKDGIAALENKAGIPEISGVLNAFFADFGTGDAVTERGRVAAAKGEMQNALFALEKTLVAESRIWRTCGICAGLILGIMLI